MGKNEAIVSKSDIETAIGYIEYARETHVDWAKWIKERPQEAERLRPAKEVGGDIEHHEEWVHQYDHVLKVLSAVKNRLTAGDEHETRHPQTK